MGNNRNVVYNFTANTRGMNAGVSEAIKLLDTLSRKTESLQPSGGKGGFGVTSVNRLNEALQTSVNALTDLKSQMATMGPRKDLYGEARLMTEQASQLQGILNNYDTYLAQGDKGVVQMTQDLLTASMAAADLMARFRNLTLGTKSVALGGQQIINDATMAATTAPSAAKKDKAAFTRQKNTAKKATQVAGVDDRVVAYTPNMSGMKRGASDAQAALKSIAASSVSQGTSTMFATLTHQVELFAAKLKSIDPSSMGQARDIIKQVSAAMENLNRAQQLASSSTALDAADQQTLSQALTGAAVAMRSANYEVNKRVAMSKQTTAAAKAGVAAAYDDAKTAKMDESAQADDARAKQTNAQATQTSTKANTKLSDVFRLLQSYTPRVSSGLQDINLKLDALKNTLNTVQSIARKAGSALVGLAGVTMTTFTADTMKQAVDYVEIMEMFRVATQGCTSAAYGFVNSMEDVYGLDPNTIMSSVGMFAQLAGAIEMPTQAAETLSLGLTKAAVDISALFNTDFETTIQDITSGMMGMTRAVRKYGLDLRNTTLQVTASKIGLQGQIETMSEANRQGLRYLTILQQSTNAAGNYQKTIESVANQLRVFKEQVLGVCRNLGNLFLPALQNIIYKVNAVAMVLKMLLQYVAAFAVGYKPQTFEEMSSGASSAAASVGAVGDAAKQTAKEVKNLMGFDELNLLDDPSSSSSGSSGSSGSAGETMDPKLVDAVMSAQNQLENFQMKASKLRDEILSFMGFVGNYDFKFNFDTGEWETDIKWSADVFQKNLVDKFPQWKNTINSLFDQWPGIMSGMRSVWDAGWAAAGATLAPIKDEIRNVFSDDNVSGFLTVLPTHLQDAANMIMGWAPTFQAATQVIVDAVTGVFNAIDWSGIVAAFDGLMKALAPATAGLGSGLVDFLKSLAGAASDVLIGFMEALTNVLNNMSPSTLNAVGKAFGVFATGALLLKPAFSGLSGLSNILIPLLALKNLGGLGGSAASLAPIAGVFSELGAAASLMGGTLVSAFTSIGTSLGTVFLPIITTVGTFLSTFILPIFTTLGTSIMTFLAPAFSTIGTLLAPIGGFFTSIGTSLTTLLAPAFTKISTLLAPLIKLFGSFGTILGTLSPGATLVVLAAVAAAIAVVVANSEELQAKFGEAWESIKAVLGVAWNTVIKPILDAVIAMLSDLWKKHIAPFIESVLNAVLNLWNGVLAPLVAFIVQTFGPIISNIISALLPIFSHVFGAIFDILSWLINVLGDVIAFVSDVFRGDWNAAWSDIKDVWNDLWGGLWSVVKDCINVIIDLINGLIAAVWSGIVSIINTVGGTVKILGNILGKNWGWSIPSRPLQIPMLATGGVVTGPTPALIGEGRYDEAVIPLGNSPQMHEMIQAIADALDAKPSRGPTASNTPLYANIYIGNEELGEYVAQAQARRNLQTNGGY